MDDDDDPRQQLSINVVTRQVKVSAITHLARGERWPVTAPSSAAKAAAEDRDDYIDSVTSGQLTAVVADRFPSLVTGENLWLQRWFDEHFYLAIVRCHGELPRDVFAKDLMGGTPQSLCIKLDTLLPFEWVGHGIATLIHGRSAASLAAFLFKSWESLDKTGLAALLGGCSPSNGQLRDEFMRHFAPLLPRMPLDDALRLLVTRCGLPKESQQIYRVVEAFSAVYATAQQKAAATCDATGQNCPAEPVTPSVPSTAIPRVPTPTQRLKQMLLAPRLPQRPQPPWFTDPGQALQLLHGLLMVNTMRRRQKRQQLTRTEFVQMMTNALALPSCKETEGWLETLWTNISNDEIRVADTPAADFYANRYPQARLESLQLPCYVTRNRRCRCIVVHSNGKPVPEKTQHSAVRPRLLLGIGVSSGTFTPAPPTGNSGKPALPAVATKATERNDAIVLPFNSALVWVSSRRQAVAYFTEDTLHLTPVRQRVLTPTRSTASAPARVGGPGMSSSPSAGTLLRMGRLGLLRKKDTVPAAVPIADIHAVKFVLRVCNHDHQQHQRGPVHHHGVEEYPDTVVTVQPPKITEDQHRLFYEPLCCCSEQLRFEFRHEPGESDPPSLSVPMSQTSEPLLKFPVAEEPPGSVKPPEDMMDFRPPQLHSKINVRFHAAGTGSVEAMSVTPTPPAVTTAQIRAASSKKTRRRRRSSNAGRAAHQLARDRYAVMEGRQTSMGLAAVAGKKCNGDDGNENAPPTSAAVPPPPSIVIQRSATARSRLNCDDPLSASQSQDAFVANLRQEPRRSSLPYLPTEEKAQPALLCVCQLCAEEVFTVASVTLTIRGGTSFTLQPDDSREPEGWRTFAVLLAAVVKGCPEATRYLHRRAPELPDISELPPVIQNPRDHMSREMRAGYTQFVGYRPGVVNDPQTRQASLKKIPTFFSQQAVQLFLLGSPPKLSVHLWQQALDPWRASEKGRPYQQGETGHRTLTPELLTSSLTDIVSLSARDQRDLLQFLLAPQIARECIEQNPELLACKHSAQPEPAGHMEERTAIAFRQCAACLAATLMHHRGGFRAAAVVSLPLTRRDDALGLLDKLSAMGLNPCRPEMRPPAVVARHFAMLGLDYVDVVKIWWCSLFALSPLPTGTAARVIDLICVYGEAVLQRCADLLFKSMAADVERWGLTEALCNCFFEANWPPDRMRRFLAGITAGGAGW